MLSVACSLHLIHHNLGFPYDSRNKYTRGMKGTMKRETEEAIMSFFDGVHSYIASLTDIADNPIFVTLKRALFIGFMVPIKTVQVL